MAIANRTMETIRVRSLTQTHIGCTNVHRWQTVDGGCAHQQNHIAHHMNARLQYILLYLTHRRAHARARKLKTKTTTEKKLVEFCV